MNVPMGSKWSERQQVVAILLIAGALLALLWFFLLLPLNRQRHRMEGDISGLSSELAQKNFLLGEEALQHKLDEQVAHQQALNDEWQKAVQSFGDLAAQDDATTSSVAHIDFKVALFDVRQRLLQKSRTLGVSLPRDLGVDETIESDDDAYQRMVQLRVVEKLVDLALDLKIKTIREIRSLPPVLHKTALQEDFFREYPLELMLSGTQDHLYEFLDVVSEPGHVFVLRGLRVEPSGKGRGDLLNIKALMSGLVFIKSPSELIRAPAPKATQPRPPAGH
jgi:Tfp pilus assembly protein PilO